MFTQNYLQYTMFNIQSIYNIIDNNFKYYNLTLLITILDMVDRSGVDDKTKLIVNILLNKIKIKTHSSPK